MRNKPRNTLKLSVGTDVPVSGRKEISTCITDKPNIFRAFSVILLKHEQHYLLLRRSETKHFAPGRWTGIGGGVEPDEFDNLQASALRELDEEAGFSPQDLEHFVLRRILLHAKPEGSLTMLLYFTGSLKKRSTPSCPEGTLVWMRPEEISAVDIIDSTRPVIPLLIADQERDPTGRERTRLGVSHYQVNGVFEEILWT